MSTQETASQIYKIAEALTASKSVSESLPTEWYDSKAFYSATGIRVQFQKTDVYFPTEQVKMTLDATIMFMVYSDRQVYSRAVGDMEIFAKFRKFLHKFTWPDFANSKTMSGSTSELDLKKWSQVFAFAFRSYHWYEKRHPFLTLREVSSWKKLLELDYFQKGYFATDCALGFRDTDDATTEYYKKHKTTSAVGGHVFTALSEINSKSTMGILANLNVKCSVGLIVILMKNEHLTANTDEGTSEYNEERELWLTGVFPSAIHAPFVVAADARNVNVSGKSSISIQLCFWTCLMKGWDEYVTNCVTENNEELFRLHKTSFGDPLTEVLADENRNIKKWSDTLNNEFARVNVENPMVSLQLYMLSKNLKVEEMDSYFSNKEKDGKITFPSHDYERDVVWTIKEGENADADSFIAFVRDLLENDYRFDMLSTGLSIWPWNTVRLFPMVYCNDKWAMSASVCCLLLILWLDDAASAPSDTTSQVDFPQECADAIARYTAEITHQRPENWPPADHPFRNAELFKRETGLNVNKISYPDNEHYYDGTVEIGDQNIHVGPLLFLLLSEINPSSDLVTDKNAWYRFRAKLGRIVNTTTGHVPWDMPVLNKGVYCWNNKPSAYRTGSHHPALEGGLRNAKNIYYTKYGKWVTEPVILSYILSHSPSKDWENHDYLSVLREVGMRYTVQKYNSFARASNHAPYFRLAKSIIQIFLVGSYVPNKPVTGELINDMYADGYKLFDVDENGMVGPDKICPGKFFNSLTTIDDIPKPLPNFAKTSAFQSRLNEWLSVHLGKYHPGVRRVLKNFYDSIGNFNTDVLLTPDVINRIVKNKEYGFLVEVWKKKITDILHDNRGKTMRFHLHTDFANSTDKNEGSREWLVPDSADRWQTFVNSVLNDNVLDFNMFDVNPLTAAEKVTIFPLLDPTTRWKTFRFRPLELLALIGTAFNDIQEQVSDRKLGVVLWKLAVRSENVNDPVLLRARRHVFLKPNSNEDCIVRYHDDGEIFVDGRSIMKAKPAFADAFVLRALVLKDFNLLSGIIDIDRRSFDYAIRLTWNETEFAKIIARATVQEMNLWMMMAKEKTVFYDRQHPPEFNTVYLSDAWYDKYKRLVFLLSEGPLPVKLNASQYIFQTQPTVTVSADSGVYSQVYASAPQPQMMKKYVSRYTHNVITDILYRELTDVKLKNPVLVVRNVLTEQETELLSRPLTLPLYHTVGEELLRLLPRMKDNKNNAKMIDAYVGWVKSLNSFYTLMTEEGEEKFAKNRCRFPINVMTKNKIPYMSMAKDALVLDDDTVQLGLRDLFHALIQGDFEVLDTKRQDPMIMFGNLSQEEEEMQADQMYESLETTKRKLSIFETMRELLHERDDIQDFVEMMSNRYEGLIIEKSFGELTYDDDASLMGTVYTRDVGTRLREIFNEADYPLYIEDSDKLVTRPRSLIEAIRQVKTRELNLPFMNYQRNDREIMVDILDRLTKREVNRLDPIDAPDIEIFTRNERGEEEEESAMLKKIGESIFLYVCSMMLAAKKAGTEAALTVKAANDGALDEKSIAFLNEKYPPQMLNSHSLSSVYTNNMYPELQHITLGHVVQNANNHPWASFLLFVSEKCPTQWFRLVGFSNRFINDYREAIGNTEPVWTRLIHNNSSMWHNVIDVKRYVHLLHREVNSDSDLKVVDNKGWLAVSRALDNKTGPWGYWNGLEWKPLSDPISPYRLLKHYEAASSGVPRLRDIVSLVSAPVERIHVRQMLLSSDVDWTRLPWGALWYDLRQTTKQKYVPSEEVPTKKNKKKDKKTSIPENSNNAMWIVGGIAASAVAATAAAVVISKKRKPTRGTYAVQYHQPPH